MTPEPAPSAAELATAFGLRRTGPRDFNGPCPLCGGRDRFHVRDRDGRGVFGCRQCIDGAAPADRAAKFGEIMALFRFDVIPHRAPPPVDGPGRRPKLSGVAFARQQWSRATAIPADQLHPARRWLAGTAGHGPLWRPSVPLPPSVRWLADKRGGRVGAIVAGLAPPGAGGRVSGVELISIDVAGMPALDKHGEGARRKRAHGDLVGAVCVVGLLDPDGGAVNVCEGLADALAVAARTVEAAICMRGTQGLRNLQLARWLASTFAHVGVWGDRDGEDPRAAPLLAQRVEVLGGTASLEVVAEGGDPGAAGAAFAQLDAAAVAGLDADLQADGVPAWEAARLASVICASMT